MQGPPSMGCVAGSPEQANSIGMKFVLIPPGEFDMGTTQAELDRRLAEAKARNEAKWYTDALLGETPQHRVRISQHVAFAVAQFHGRTPRIIVNQPSGRPIANRRIRVLTN